MFKYTRNGVAVLLFALILGACAGGTQGGGGTAAAAGDEDVEVVFAWWGNPVRNEMTYDVLNLFQAEHPRISVEQHTVGWGEYWSMLATMAAGGNLPDVIQMSDAYLHQYWTNDLIIDLQPLMNSGVIDVSDVDPSLIELGRVYDVIPALSIGINASAMFYNKTLLDSMGISINHHMTMDDFIQLSRRIYAESGYKTFFATELILQTMVRARGAVMFTPEGLGGLPEYYQEFYDILMMGLDEGWIIHPEALAGRTGFEESSLFFGSEPAFRTWNYVSWSNLLSAFQAVAPEGMELGMTSRPSMDPRQGNVVRSSMFLAVTTHSDHPEAAASIIDFFTNSIEANEIMLAERGLPISSVVSEAILPYMDSAAQITHYFVNDVMIPYSSPIDPPNPDGTAAVNNHMAHVLDMVVHGAMSPADAVREIFDFAEMTFSQN